jgi:hypothetical protein
MARRPGTVLAGLLLLAALTLPAALAASAGPALAATAQSGQSPVSVAITGMTPQQAGPGATITVTGTLTNVSRQQISHLSVQLLASSAPVSSAAELQPATALADGLAGTEISGASWPMAGQLQPAATVRWSIRVRASAIGMTTFGAYPIAAQAQSSPVAVPLATTVSYLPYVPARKGPYGYSIPARTAISWVWPLLSQPLLNQPWVASNCSGAQAQQLARSLTSTGRLGQLVAAGAASRDGVTWAVDPALLANAQALAGCGRAQPQWAKTARAWLAEVSHVTSGQPLFVTPYADPNVAALISSSHASDVRRAFQLGRSVARQILNRDLTPPASAGTPAAQAAAAGIAWPADGLSGYTTAENLAAADGVQTLLLSSSALPAEQATVVRALNGGGGYVNLVLASAGLSHLLSSAGTTASSAFATSQEFLAQTALLAQQDPGQPIVVAPPRRWAPATGLAGDLLTDTASASWLRPVSVGSLATGKKVASVPDALLSISTRPGRIAPAELAELTDVDRAIAQLETLKYRRDSDTYLALATVESSAWRGASNATAIEMLDTLESRIAAQEKDVEIVAETRITLGGLKGSVPVSIDNRLGYPVQVRLRLHFSQADGVKITEDPGGLITVLAHTAQTVRLRVQATQVGSTVVSMSLQNRDFDALPAHTDRMTVQATQVGVLGMIICAAALGIALIAYAARAARGSRRGPADPAAGTAVPAGQDDGQSAQEAEPDTVMAERTELGTAGSPGP